MRYEVKLTSFGDEPDEKAQVVTWLANEGDTVSEGDDLLELTTDKAAFTLPSPKQGVLVKQCAAEDEDLKEGDVVCILEVAG